MKQRPLTVVALATLSVLAFAGAAQAHVTLHPNAVPSGAFVVVDINVPNESDSASTVKLDVKLPPGILSASIQPVPGWQTRVITQKLAKPVKVEDEMVTTRVDRIVFSRGRIGPGQFQSFPVSLLLPEAKPGTLLVFKALQTYSNGKIVRWIDPTAEEPAPQLLIRPASSPSLDYPAGVAAAKAGLGHTLKGVAVGLPLGAFGLYLALRRRRKAG